MAGNELCFEPATTLIGRIRRKEVSALEVMRAHLAQIDRVNPAVHAIVTLVPEPALAGARAADDTLARGKPLGPLHGLPIAHKDLEATQGIRTTFGSRLYRDFVPDYNTLQVSRLQDAGAITIGKTNTPEFGAGSQTYNEVFGETLNPYDTALTCGGSSGGAAVALACGMVPLADGSDFGGSLRNPASFCNVVGFRTSPGRVPVYPAPLGWWTLSVVGPMARTVADVALMLSATAGPDSRVPIAIAEAGDRFAGSLSYDFRGTRLAWSENLGGLPVDPRVTAVLEAQRPVFRDIGCAIEEAEPNFAGADEVFKGWRAWRSHLTHADAVARHRDLYKDTIIAEVEQGARLTGPELGRLERLRTEIYQRVQTFFERYDFLLLPVSQVPPFDVRERFVTAINGVPMASYIDWMKTCYFLSITGLPAISVPCGFTEEGLPVGLQIVGRHQDELGVLRLAHAFEHATEHWRRHPELAIAG